MRKDNIRPFDEEFAAAADDFFAGTIERTEREDTELAVLLDTLERVGEAFQVSDEAEARERLRKNLRTAWFELENQEEVQTPGFLSQLRDFFSQNRFQTGVAVSFAMILLMLVVAPAFFGTEPAIAGTAGSWLSSPTVVIVLLVGLVSTLFWVLRRPNK